MASLRASHWTTQARRQTCPTNSIRPCGEPLAIGMGAVRIHSNAPEKWGLEFGRARLCRVTGSCRARMIERLARRHAPQDNSAPFQVGAVLRRPAGGSLPMNRAFSPVEIENEGWSVN